MALKYGGKTISDYSAMRGPCPEGFHVPLYSELNGLKETLSTTFGISLSGSSMGDYLKMPFAGLRGGDDGNISGVDTEGNYWTSSHNPEFASYLFFLLKINSTEARFYSGGPNGGYSIRPFKDGPVNPDSAWTTLYDGSSVANGAGIFRNSSLGLISVSGDGINWVTIADKNLGATTVYNSGDTLTANNCGGYFQWGNCYMFSFAGTEPTSRTTVDITGYGPGNYYYGDTFIVYYIWFTANSQAAKTRAYNLRGGETGVKQNPVDIVERYYGGKLVNDYSAMRGPCPEGFHVPSDGERDAVKTIIAPFLGGRPTGIDCGTYLHIPFSGYRDYTDASIKAVDTQGYYWSHSTGYSSEYASMFVTEENVINAYMSKFLAIGACIRGFKDVYSEPDSSWTVALGSLGGAGVFWNQSKGLISLTDGTNKYTIMDKNLGATVVYNNGDTLTQSNCGYYYQRGNNYGFARAGSFSTSNTQVDASSYGPNNPYYSNVFIIGSHDWSSVKNWNLRGGATGVRQRPAKVIEVYHNTTKIWPGVISYNIDDIKSGTAILPAETVKKMVIDFSTVNPGWTVFQMNGTSNHMYITSTTSFVIDIGINGFSTLADLSSYGRSSPSETSGTVELDFASDTYNINITSIIDGVSAPYSDSGIMNSNGPFAITDRVRQESSGVSTGTVSIVV